MTERVDYVLVPLGAEGLPPMTDAQRRLYTAFGVAYFWKHEDEHGIVSYEPIEKLAELVLETKDV
jgi:hypothetical protein